MSILAFVGDNRFLNCDIVSPAVLKTLSEGTDVPSVIGTFFAARKSKGKLTFP